MMMRWCAALAVAVAAAACIQVDLGPGTQPAAAPIAATASYTGPVVDFTWSPAAPRAGQSIAFTPEVRVLKGTGISSFAWSFGEGTTSSKGSTTHSFPSLGPKTVTLAVRSSDGRTAKASHVIPVGDGSSGAQGSTTTGGPAPPTIPDPVISVVANDLSFAFSFTWPESPDSVGWDFGDGTTSEEAAPNHTYATAGTYQVALHVLKDDQLRSAAAHLVAGKPYAFHEFAVTPAFEVIQDLYEPTIDVSNTGVIYLAAHVVGVDSTGSPAFVSRDGGSTWSQLPMAQSTAVPSPAGGGAPPPGDEMFIATGDDGWAYGVDITLATYPVTFWAGDGARMAYHDPNAYNEADEASCVGEPIKDRPWAAYANGTLLMVNNQGAGPAQVGIMHVPTESAAGLGVLDATWNLCAGPGGSIPGVPDLRPDGLFAVPQRSDGALYVVLGHASHVKDVTSVKAFAVTTAGEITSEFPMAAFDARGTVYAAATNNSANAKHGAFRLAVSNDDGATFHAREFPTGDRAVRSLYMDGNHHGPGALVVWSVDGSSGYDWYTAQVGVGADGGPVLDNILLAIDEGPQPSADVTGAAVGPDGRAYLAMHRNSGLGSTPLSVFIQEGGPTLPIDGPTS